MSEMRHAPRLALVAVSAALVAGGGVLLVPAQADAASSPEHPALVGVAPLLPLDPGVDGDQLLKNHGHVGGKIKGRTNAVNQNSPTNNFGNQHNSSVNSGGQNNFQAAQCKRVKYCKIKQKIIVQRHFWGYSNTRRLRLSALKWPSARRHSSASSASSSSSASTISGWTLAMLKEGVPPVDLSPTRPAISGPAEEAPQ
jgi:hypothetical protein